MIVWVDDCSVEGHQAGAHGHVRFVERCMHQQPLEASCQACEFGTNPLQCPDCGYAYDWVEHEVRCRGGLQ